MKSPTALIFDLDGVLVDSEPLHKRAKERAFEEFGIVLPESVYDSYKGRPDATMMPEVLTARGWAPDKIQKLARRKDEVFDEIKHELAAVPGAVDFVLWAETRYKIALATSASPRNRETAFAVLGIGDRFHAMIDSTGHTRPKPDPEVFLLAMQQLNVKADECWIIEDSVNGLRAAKAAGSLAIAITTTFDRETLSAAGADFVVDSFPEVREMLESL
ncbi:MAG: HAD family phosphatase [Candidatus Sulfotelmatobacter sp.]